MKSRALLPFALAVSALIGLSACDKANPVAPEGTVLTITATPSQISPSGSSTIQVFALKPNGTPVNPGTQIRLTTDLGTVTPIVEADSSGVAIGTLEADGRVGTATVTARAGAVVEGVSTTVQVGQPATSITLQASPGQVPADGGTVGLLATVRDQTGEPVADVAVNFQTEVGTLNSRGGILRTDSDGQVEDTLRVTQSDLDAVSNVTSFQVGAVAGTSGGGTTSASAEIRINRCAPIASFTATVGSNQTVTLSNTTTGEEPISYLWDFGGQIEQQGLETVKNPGTIRYVTPGQKNITLRAENRCDTSFASQTVNPQP
jgi:hypothetical protein